MIKSGGSGFYILHPIMILSIVAGGMIITFLEKTKIVVNRSRYVLSIMFVVLLFINLMAGGILGRYAALIYQWNERNYSPIENAIYSNIPRGSIVWGAPEIWYATVKNGSQLQLLGEPNPLMHDFAVVRDESISKVSNDFTMIAKIGSPFPKVFGKITLSASDYQLYIWISKYRK